MVMHDCQIGYTSINTATLSPISPISGDTFTVKGGIGKASLIEASFISANCDYGRLSGIDFLPYGAYVPGSVMGSIRQKWRLPRVPLTESQPLTVEAYQSSGGAQSVAAIVSVRYDGIGEMVSPDALVGKRMVIVRLSATVASGVKTNIGNITDNLDKSKKYAVVALMGYSTNLKALMIRGTDTAGLDCGGACVNNTVDDYGVVDFSERGECPVVNAANIVNLLAYANGAETVTAFAFLFEL